MKELANYPFWFCILGANAAHDTASFAFGKSVHNFFINQLKFSGSGLSRTNR